MTPLGFVVRTSLGYWQLIQHKHPNIEKRLEEVKSCLASPQQVRSSKHDTAVYLFYRRSGPYHLCVVVKWLNGDGFVVTCYVTDAVKEGAQIWPISE
jgi:hypothetical protein